MDVVQVFYYNLMQVLYASCPFDTGNMLKHITMVDTPDYIVITISGPTARGYDYARAVNEGLSAIAQNRTRSPKEEKNFHWIQRAIEQAGELTGEQVEIREVN